MKHNLLVRSCSTVIDFCSTGGRLLVIPTIATSALAAAFHAIPFQALAILGLVSASGCDMGWPAVFVGQAGAKRVETAVEPLCIELTAADHAWKIKYPRKIGTFAVNRAPQSVNDLHIPVDVPVILILKSDDYVYTLAIPQFNVREIAVPELEFRMAVHAKQAGEYRLVGEEMCGFPESDGEIRLVVEPRTRFQSWLKKQLASQR